MEEKAQGAIEYLLIIGAAVIIAVIVIALMMGLAGQGTGAADDAGIDETFVSLQCQKDCCFTNDAMTSANKTCVDYSSCTQAAVDAC
jgi:uncharacterized protein (UPF0333 family)